jgi:hypothetical protein
MKNFNKSYLLTLALLFGCNESSNDGDTISCVDVISPAIEVSVIDKETKQIVICDATIIIEDTNYSEVLGHPPYQPCENNYVTTGGLGRTGIYNVHVYKEGYLDWSQYNIEVTANTCGVNTVRVEALLEK